MYEKDDTGTFVVRPKAVPKNFCHEVSITLRKSNLLAKGFDTLQFLQWHKDVRASSGETSTVYFTSPQ